jgi:hypothetical protein
MAVTSVGRDTICDTWAAPAGLAVAGAQPIGRDRRSATPVLARGAWVSQMVQGG